MRSYRSSFLGLVLVLALSACSPVPIRGPESPLLAQSPLPSGTASPVTGTTQANSNTAVVPTSSIVITPEPGMAVVTGQIYTLSGRGPIPQTSLYLLRQAAEPKTIVAPDEKNGDVRTRSDANGHFVLTKVPPGEYRLVVWAPYEWLEAVQSATDDTPLTIKVEAGQQLDLGTVNVWWP